jgi:hypothetical protein
MNFIYTVFYILLQPTYTFTSNFTLYYNLHTRSLVILHFTTTYIHIH